MKCIGPISSQNNSQQSRNLCQITLGIVFSLHKFLTETVVEKVSLLYLSFLLKLKFPEW